MFIIKQLDSGKWGWEFVRVGGTRLERSGIEHPTLEMCLTAVRAINAGHHVVKDNDGNTF